MAAYAALGGPAIIAGGGKFLVRGMPTAVFEEGALQRTVIIEFESVERALATYNSAEYAKALEALKGGCEREVRICEGTE